MAQVQLVAVLTKFSIFGALFFSPSTAFTQEEENVSAVGINTTSSEKDAFPAEGAIAPTGSVKPWAEGISATDQKAALSSFNKGNDFFSRRQYAEALKLYNVALGHWKHPAIHFNAAVCQVNLDQPIAAFENIKDSLSYGESPLGNAAYAQALTYQKLLFDRLGHLTVSIKNEGAILSLDGAELLIGPGEAKRVILPGKHQLVAKKKDYLTYAQTIQVTSGEPTKVKVRMKTLREARDYDGPMPTWLPWTVTGAGLVVGLSGLGMRAIAANHLNEYDDYIDEHCPCIANELPDDITSKEKSAQTWTTASIAAISIGAAGVLTGINLLLINHLVPAAARKTNDVAFVPRLTPQVDLGGARLHLNMSF